MPTDAFDFERAIAENATIQAARARALAVLRPSEADLQHGLELHADAVVVDGFGFLPNVWTDALVAELAVLREGHVGAKETHYRSINLRSTAALYEESAALEYLAAVKAAGLSAMVQTAGEGKTRELDIKRMAVFPGVCQAFESHLVMGGWADHAQRAQAEGRTAVFLSVNGPPCPWAMHDGDEEVGWLETWHQLGVRLMHLTYNRRNGVASGCMEDRDDGVSLFGRDLIARMNEVGIVVDTSHSGPQTTLDAAVLSERPIVASHSGCRALRDHPRNKHDEAIRAIADSGGLIGMTVIPGFLGRSADLNALLDHIDHAVGLVGADHVAIGTDVCYVPPWPAGLKGFSEARWSSQWWGAWKPEYTSAPSDEHQFGSLAWTNWPMYTVGLVTRGYSDDDIRKIIGGNVLRVLAANEPRGMVRV